MVSSAILLLVAMFCHKASPKEKTFRFFFLLSLQNVTGEVWVQIQGVAAF